MQLKRMLKERAISAEAPANFGAGSWSATLAGVIADLDHLNQHTEQDFLQIGGELSGFIEAANTISSDLAALMNQEESGEKARALTTALDRFIGMTERYADRTGLLVGMRGEACSLTQTLSGFESTARTFDAICLLTRIETARLNSTNVEFANLVEDVRLMADNVRSRVKCAIEASELLLPPIELAMLKISALEAGLAQDLPSVRMGVSAIRDIHDQAYDSSVRLGNQYAAISSAFNKLIVSIQFHDLTRQQVEHVIEILRLLHAEAEGGKAGAWNGRRGAVNVLALQSLQLAHAEEKFSASVGLILQNLQHIAGSVKDMAQGSLELSGSSPDNNESLRMQMEAGCTIILASLSHCADAESAARVTSESLTGTIGEVRGPILEINAIENQVRIMAINAAIRAIQIGTAGNPLCALAGKMGQEAALTGAASESLINALDLIGEAASHLSAGAGPAAGSDHGNDLEGMRLQVAAMHSSSAQSFAQIAQIVSRGDRLCEDLTAACRNFAIGTPFSEAVSRARSALKEIGETLRSGLPLDETGADAADLKDFTKHYTMQSEHEVHEGAMQNATSGPPAEQSKASPDGGGMGDNVEFF